MHDSNQSTRRRFTRAATGVALATAIFPAAAAATPVELGGSMEGNIKVASGDQISAGYSFTVPGAHPALTTKVGNARVTITGTCSNGGTDTVVVAFPDASFDVPASSSAWYPTGDQGSAASFQGAVTADVCGGAGVLPASRGATFDADVMASSALYPIHLRFHYRDPRAKGKANVRCSEGDYSAATCGASWSPTGSVRAPGPLTDPGEILAG